MLKQIKNKITTFFSEGNERTLRAKKNIVASFFIKGLSILVTLMIVPITLNFLDETRYGIWLTLTSILGWMFFFDIGLGSGLRNKLAEAKARGEDALGRVYVSTTFALVFLISICLLLLFLLINPFLDWTRILNTDVSLAHELSKTVLIVFAFFCLQFVFRLAGTILLADQKPAWNDFLNLCGNALSLGIIIILMTVTKGSLLGAGIAFSASPVVVFLIAAVVMFKGKYKNYTPSLKFIKFEKTNDLLGLGAKFFIIQLSFLILFSTSNIIISQMFGPAEVTPYNIAFRYFSIITLVFSIIVTPFWTASTDAYHKGEIIWIKNAIKKLVVIWGASCLVLVMMVMSASWVYRLWVGGDIHIPLSLSIVTALLVAIHTWHNIFVLFLNGVSKIRLQLYSSIFVGIINIPLAILLGRWLNGVEGIVLSVCICLLISSVWAPIQYLKIVKGTAKGIWNK